MIEQKTICGRVDLTEESGLDLIRFWEATPKYFFTPEMLEALRSPDGHLGIYKKDYCYENIGYSIRLRPAQILQDNGAYLSFFPESTEGLVEKALKNIFLKQLESRPESGQRFFFSYDMISNELASMGKNLSFEQIKRSIKIMSCCNITLYKAGQEFWCGFILQDLMRIDYGVEIPADEVRYMVALPIFFSQQNFSKLRWS